ncbi:MAG: TatD family hydrolase [Candidatus Pacebacteria bacterium]|nr:TatD family hydrolase [Candidatus Paceibacterota bacterium]
MYIDTHSHVYFPQFDTDRDAVYEHMRANTVRTIVVGTSLKTSTQALQAAQDTPDVVLAATIGVHPNAAAEGFDAVAFEGLLSSNIRGTVCGVGECGIDYYRGATDQEKTKQKEVFQAQIEFALAHDLPLMLHVRSSKGTDDAHQDALAILDAYQKAHGEKVRGTSHFFTASLAVAREYWNRGFATSFPGVITFAKECEEVVRLAPAHLILSETDAPYAAPVPHRGQRNEPAFVVEVVKKIAEVRGEEIERTQEQLLKNAQRIFGVV